MLSRTFYCIPLARDNGLRQKASYIGRARQFPLLYRMSYTLRPSYAFFIVRRLFILLLHRPRSPQRAVSEGQPHRASEAFPCALPHAPGPAFLIGLYQVVSRIGRVRGLGSVVFIDARRNGLCHVASRIGRAGLLLATSC